MLAAALDWWREAGVDCAFVDEPQGWLAEPAAAVDDRLVRAPIQPPAAEKPAPAPAQRLGGDPARYPQSLEEFARWWLTEPSLDPAPPNQRVPPFGQAGAELMVLVGTPEPGDEAVLLSGKAGQLLDAMLAAFALSRDRIYLASALPAPSPMPDWTALAEAGLTEVVRHHIRLAAPKRLLVLGRSVASTLFSHDPAKNAQTLPAFNHEGTSLPFMASFDLEAMLAKPVLKAGVWKSWLEWTGSDT